MRAIIKVYEVELTGGSNAVREALGPLFALIGGAAAPIEEPIPGPTMQPASVAFLAAHGFTVEDFHRSRRRDEDCEAFVARLELEQAGISYSRTAPGGEKRGPTGKVKACGAVDPDDADPDGVCARPEGHTGEHRCAAALDIFGPVDPSPVVPNLRGMDPAKFRDRMNAIPAPKPGRDAVHPAPKRWVEPEGEG